MALRIRQIVSSDDRLRTRVLAELRDFLLNRGYNEVAIQEQFERAAGVPRQQALQKRRRVTNDRVPLVCSWNKRLPDLRRILRQYFPVLRSEASLEQCFTSPPLLSFRRPRSLRDILVYGTQKNTSAQDAPIGTHQCLHSRCLTCPIVHDITQIQTNSGLKHIRDRFTCDTSSLVYVITCSKCNSVYVGETGQKLRERMNGHRADIKNKNHTPVRLHDFNAKGHEPRISGLQKNSSGHNSEESPREEVDQTSGIVQNVQVHEPRLGHWLPHYRKRGSSSYIVREVRSVRERERERYRERERELDGSDVNIVALKLAMRLHFPMPKIRTIAVSSHFPLPKNRTFRFSLHISCLTIVTLEFTLSVVKKIALVVPTLSSMAQGARRVIENPRPMIKFCPVLLFFPSKNWINLIPKTIGNRKRDCAWGGSGW